MTRTDETGQAAPHPSACWRSCRKIGGYARKAYSGVRNIVTKTRARCVRFPNAGGFGCDVRYDGRRQFGFHFHRVRGKYRPHYQRRPGIVLQSQIAT